MDSDTPIIESRKLGIKSFRFLSILFIVLFVFILIAGFFILREYRGRLIETDKELKSYLERNFDQLELMEENKSMKKEMEQLVLSRSVLKVRNREIDALINRSFYNHRGEYKIAFLTFDDGPSENTERILDILKEYNIHATFFVNAKYGDYSKGIYKRIIKEGHVIGNHTATHEYSDLYASVKGFEEDVDTLNEFLLETVGEIPSVYRLPGGSNNTISHRYGGWDIMDKVVAYCDEKGYLYADWNITSGDASWRIRPKEYLVNRVVSETLSLHGESAVILMHDTRRNMTTPDAVPEIIEKLLKEGYVFLPLSKEYSSMVPQFKKVEDNTDE